MIERGILFGNVHSYRDLDLILSGVVISPAEPKTTYIDIPGGDGSLDLTEALGEVKYGDRVMVITLTMNPAHELSEAAWEEKKTQVSNALNGLACKIILDKDPRYYWTGRCAIDNYHSQKRLRQFTIAARVRPYKNKLEETVVNVSLADPNTEDGIDPVTRKIVLSNGRKSVCPTITCTKDIVVKFGGGTFNFGAGTHKNLDIRLLHGENEITITGTGAVTFKYQEADL